MIPRGWFLGSVLGVMCSSEAGAQGHGWRLSVERVAGIGYNSITTSRTEAGRASESTSTLTTANVFGSTLATPGNVVAVLAAPSPRLALDYEFSSHLTVGFAAMLQWSSGALPSGSERYDTFTVGVAPRVGYSARITNRLFFWPRAGVTFSRFSQSSGAGSSRETTWTELSLNLEPTLVFAPVENFGLMLTLLGDIPLIGDVESSDRPTQTKVMTVALQLGAQARF